jgi:Type II CAAX prenyl endopeptidase Rce1-like
VRVKDYLGRSRASRYSLLFALPLLLLYEGLSFVLTGSAVAGVRNGADVLLKGVFLAIGGRYGLTAFNVVLATVGAVLVWRDRRANRGPLEGRIFALMLAESALYAALFGIVVGSLTALILDVPRLLQIGGGALDLPTQLVVSLGAGIYEELLFRVVLTGGLLWGLQLVLGMTRPSAAIGAVVVSALIFSAFHYVGALGDAFSVGSFVFRAIAGVAFSGLYVTRGLGITAWTHALYDVGLTLLT